MSQLSDIKTNFPEWYNEVVYAAELADQSPVRGCMVIRPYGWAIWENIKTVLDKRIKETGHENAAFPLLIPESFIKREAKHVEGFSPELAVVTVAGGKKLEEPLVVRPTSETIIHYMFGQWIKSWRDLPMKINQWANVLRWEMRTRPFLRTTEFFWQEGHTAHETLAEAEEEVQIMLQEYVNLAQNYLAIPVIVGQKSATERFAGAEKTFTFEGIMQDGKALQMGTSHLLSQSFAHAFNIQFQDRQGNLTYPYLTSWGVTTRLIGAIIAMHGDQKGLIMPPKIAPIQIVIVPIYKDGFVEKLKTIAQELVERLKKAGVHVLFDEDESKTPGSKFYKWELKGVPLRLEIGPRDLENNQCIITERLNSTKETVVLDKHFEPIVLQKLNDLQDALFARAQDRLKSMWHYTEKLEEFRQKLEEHAGAYQTGWCQDAACEAMLKEYKGTIRCLLNAARFGHCFACGKESKQDILVAKAY